MLISVPLLTLLSTLLTTSAALSLPAVEGERVAGEDTLELHGEASNSIRIEARQQVVNTLPIVAEQCRDFCDPVNALVLAVRSIVRLWI